MMITNEIKEQLKFLDLKYLLENWNVLLSGAQKKKKSWHRFLQEIIADEYTYKRDRTRRSRIKRANIKDSWVMETFPFKKQINLKKKLVMELYDSLDYIANNQVLVFIGPTGCGKTGLATSYLIHAMNNDHRGYFIDFKVLVDALYQSIADHTEKKVLKRFESIQCLCVDELGYVSVNKEQAGLFFDLMKRRHKKKTTLITTQLGFEEWGSFLNNKHLTAALLDRLTEDCVVFNMRKCMSIREKKIVYATKENK